MSKELVASIKKIIQEQASKKSKLDIFVVTDVQKETYTVNIKHPAFKLEYKQVQILGLGLGNIRGQMMLPNVNDLVVIMFLDDTPNPLVLGSMYDVTGTFPDTIPQIQQGEYILVNQEKGSIIYMTKDNDIIIRTSNNGDTSTGAKLLLKADGSFKLFCGGNWGFEMDASGNLTTRATTSTGTLVPGTFP